MKRLFCETQLFSFRQTIRIVDDNGTVVTMKTTGGTKDLANTIAYTCADESITDVHLIGSPSFTKKVKNDILTVAEATYGLNNINVELEEVN